MRPKDKRRYTWRAHDLKVVKSKTTDATTRPKEDAKASQPDTGKEQ